jgi:hypothetical protein
MAKGSEMDRRTVFVARCLVVVVNLLNMYRYSRKMIGQE